MGIILNSVSGRLLIAMSLRSFSEVLSCFLFWNILFHFIIFFLAFCACFYVLGEMAIFFSLQGESLFSWWSFLFTHALVVSRLTPLMLSSPPKVLLICPHYWRCIKTCQCSKGTNLIYHLISGWLEAKPSGSSFYILQIYIVLWCYNYYPCWPPD